MISPLSEQTADRLRGCPRRKLTLDLRDSRHCDGRAVDDPANRARVARRRSCPGHARGSCGIAVVLGNRVYQALNFAGDMLKLRVRAEFAVHWLRRGAPAPRGTFLQTATKQMVRAPLRSFDIAPGLRSVLSQVPHPVVSRRLPCVDA